MSFAKKCLDVAASVAIIAVAVLLGVVLVKEHLLARRSAMPPQSLNQLYDSGSDRLAGPTDLSSLGIDWNQSKQTLVLAISTACHYCTDSAPFYKTLAESKKDTRLIALLPQPIEEGRSYLQRLGVSVDE